MAEHFLGKEEVGGSIPLMGSSFSNISDRIVENVTILNFKIGKNSVELPLFNLNLGEAYG